MPPFQKVAVVGVGLIGGSIGLAVRQRGLASEVVGIGRRQASLDKALQRGAVARTSTEIDAVADVEFVVVATPVDRIVPIVRAVAASAPAVLITDAGSTKATICHDLADELSDRFVGSHPLAGDHRSGPEHARPDLFEGRTVVVTPTAETTAAVAERIVSFWQALGARVTVMSPADHDQALAATSHLPHLIAAAMAAATPQEWLPLAAGGWADVTRIAASDPALWSQIFAANRGRLLEALGQFDQQLRQLRTAIEAGNWEVAEQHLQNAKRTRDALGD